jgi:hypothetical protein
MRKRAARDTSGQVYVRIEYAGGQMAADVAADVFVPQVESGLTARHVRRASIEKVRPREPEFQQRSKGIASRLRESRCRVES